MFGISSFGIFTLSHFCLSQKTFLKIGNSQNMHSFLLGKNQWGQVSPYVGFR